MAKAAGTRVVLDIDYRPVLWGLTSPGMGEQRFVPSGEVSAHLFAHGDVLIEASEAQPATLQLYTKTPTGCDPQEPREVTRPWVYLDEISVDDFVFWTEAVE